MIEKLKEADYCAPVLMASIALMVLLIASAIIIGPNYCHYLNLFAFAFTLLALIILIRNFNKYSVFKKCFLISVVIFNLTAGVYLASIKYGYGWHYVSLFRLEA